LLLQQEGIMTFDLKRWVVPVTLGLVCTFGLGTAQAANLLATETANPDTAVLTPDANWDITPFTSLSAGERATGSGTYFALLDRTGTAVVVLTEGPGGPISDWFSLVYTGANPGGAGAETFSVVWQSDADPGITPPPPGPTITLAETGGVQDVTAALTALGNFPSNITLQAQSDPPEPAPAPEPASLALLSVALIGFGGLGMARRRKRA
jgi:hypothetical protein